MYKNVTLKYSGTGNPKKNQSMQTFARQLCNENHAHGKDTGARNEKNLRLSRPSWVTETREYAQ